MNSLFSDHSCKKCNYFVKREAPVDIFPELKQSLSKEVKVALLYIAGYVDRKSPTADDTHIYVDQYGAYLKELNRNSLTFPSYSVCHWLNYSYILFDEINRYICRKSL